MFLRISLNGFEWSPGLQESRWRHSRNPNQIKTPADPTAGKRAAFHCCSQATQLTHWTRVFSSFWCNPTFPGSWSKSATLCQLFLVCFFFCLVCLFVTPSPHKVTSPCDKPTSDETNSEQTKHSWNKPQLLPAKIFFPSKPRNISLVETSIWLYFLKIYYLYFKYLTKFGFSELGIFHSGCPSRDFRTCTEKVRLACCG